MALFPAELPLLHKPSPPQNLNPELATLAVAEGPVIQKRFCKSSSLFSRWETMFEVVLSFIRNVHICFPYGHEKIDSY